MSTVRCGGAKDSSGNGRFYGLDSFLTLDPSVTYTKLPTTQTVSQMLVVKKGRGYRGRCQQGRSGADVPGPRC